jgi:hypothetical protein
MARMTDEETGYCDEQVTKTTNGRKPRLVSQSAIPLEANEVSLFSS